MSLPQPPPRRRHLIDPANPPQRPTSRETTRVQQWVVSVLVVTTILHLSAGLMISTLFIGDDQPAARIGLNIIAAVFGVLAVAAGFAIHQRSPLTPWALLGTLPGVVGLVIALA